MPDDLWSAIPGVDCMARGHIWVEHTQGAAWAQWCLWCGAGVSNEHEAGWGAGASDQGQLW